MNDSEMWAAVARDDAAFDGVFFYAVRSTGIFCRPSCKSKAPRRVNVVYFDTADDAREAGFRPCKRCRPDLLDYRPTHELAERAKQMIDVGFDDGRALDAGLRALGVTRHRLNEIFRRRYGVTLSGYIGGARLERAKAMLSGTDTAIVDIAYASGFGSLSAFYRLFRTREGMPPTEYRRRHSLREER